MRELRRFGFRILLLPNEASTGRRRWDKASGLLLLPYDTPAWGFFDRTNFENLMVAHRAVVTLERENSDTILHPSLCDFVGACGPVIEALLHLGKFTRLSKELDTVTHTNGWIGPVGVRLVL